MDLFERPKVREIAHFAPRLAVDQGVYPAFSDCPVDAQPGTQLMAFLSRRFGMMMEDVEQQGLLLNTRSTDLFAVGR